VRDARTRKLSVGFVYPEGYSFTLGVYSPPRLLTHRRPQTITGAEMPPHYLKRITTIMSLAHEIFTLSKSEQHEAIRVLAAKSSTRKEFERMTRPLLHAHYSGGARRKSSSNCAISGGRYTKAQRVAHRRLSTLNYLTSKTMWWNRTKQKSNQQ
jgi:hypothetical protein